MSRRTAAAGTGYTLLEILVVVVIIGILAVILIPVFSTFKARAQRVQCTANLRSLNIAANLFVQQNGSWPQIPVGDPDSDDLSYVQGWIAALAPFGPTQQTWVCPTVQSLLGNPDLSNPTHARLDYIPMPFDDKPTTPYRWSRYPWFIESADVHGNGNLVVFSDGSVSDLRTIAASPTPTKSIAH